MAKTPNKTNQKPPKREQRGRAPSSWRKRFLASLRQIPNVSRALRLAQVSGPTAYQHRNTDKVFASAWDEALETGHAALEESAMKLAKEGSKRGVWKTVNGKPVKVETVTEMSPVMMMFMLKSHYAKYREQSRVEHVGSADAPPIQHQALPPLMPKELEESV